MEEIYQQSRIHVYVKKSEPAKQQDGTGVWRLMICDDDLVTDSNKKNSDWYSSSILKPHTLTMKVKSVRAGE